MRNDLNELRHTSIRIRQLERQLDQLEARAERLGSPHIGERVQGGQGLDLCVVLDDMAQVRSRLTTELTIHTRLQAQFLARCAHLSNRAAIVLTYRYLDCLPIRKIARQMHYSDRQVIRLLKSAAIEYFSTSGND